MFENYQKITQPYILELEDNLQVLLRDNSNELECEILGFLFAKSKRLRPIFTYLCALLLGCKIDEDVQNLALCIELLHSATLVHDDILDESKFRREKETFFNLFGAKKAVVIGDYLLSLSLLVLSGIKNQKVVEIFAKNVLKTINGEINQFNNCFEFQDKKSYFEKSANKTASLFVCAALGVCELKSADEKTRQCLKDFALKFGTAFQLKNDIENFENNCDDIKNGIFTLCAIYYKRKNPNCDIIEMQKDEKQSCIFEALKDLDNLLDEAVEILNKNFNSDAKKYFLTLCEKIRG